jgi:CubicO group peptidase (beta-lactamase class C family)/predicted secreted protein
MNNRRLEGAADRIIRAVMREKQIPGLVLGIVKAGRGVVKKGYGVKSLGSSQPPDENTLFYIGSLSKALTAVGALQLVDDGRLRLDEPASRYLPGIPAAWQGITVAQFMSHSSGIPQLNRKLPTFEAMLRQAATLPMSFPPGTKQEYNNFNYSVVGKLIEAVGGRPYMRYMRARIFGPLRMDRTGYHLRLGNAATGFVRRRGSLVATDPAPKGGDYAIPSGFIETTLSDLLKFEAALRNGQLLKPATFHEMITPVVSGRSGTPGWFARTAGGDAIIAKNGEASGFSSQFQFVPERGDAVIMIWNYQGKGAALYPTVDALFREVCHIPISPQKTGVTPIPPSGSVTIAETQNGNGVTVPSGGTLVIRLGANRTTGYSWTANAVDAKVLQPVGQPTYERPAANRIGAPGHQVFTFRAVGAEGAATRVSLQYAQLFEKWTPPAKHYTVTVRIGGTAR